MPVDGDIILKAGLDTAGIQKSIDGIQSSISRGLKNAIRIGFGVRSVFSLLRKLRSSLISGFGDLSQVYEPFNQAVSSIMTSLNLLRNSFAAAFAPIIETVAPILVTFINLVAKAVATVGQFIAMLTGKQYVQAATTQVDYAASLDKSSKSADSAAKSTKKQTKAQKELNREITHFDDLVILHDKNKDEDTSAPVTSGGGGGGLTTVPIGNAVSQFAKDFLAAWEKADFTDIGRKLGEKLKNALDNIPWDTIKSTLSRIAQSIATFLNGFMSTPGLYYTIGQTVAEGINSAFTFVYSFITSFNWHTWGLAIEAKILGLLRTIDWPLIYSTMSALGAGIGEALETAFNNPTIWTEMFTFFSRAATALLTGMLTFLYSINWGAFGTSIGTGLNRGIEAFPWSTLAVTLIKLINSIFTAWYSFVTTFDFTKFGTHIGTTLSTTIKGINWKEGGASVAKTIEGLFEALDGFITTTDWKALGQAVIDTLEGFFEEFDWGTISQTLSDAVVGLFNALTGAFEEVDWDNLGANITDAISTFLDEFDWEAMAEAAGELIGAAFKALVEIGSDLWNTLKQFGKDIINGGFAGIKERLAIVGTWIKTNILDPFIQGFKNAFGIASPAETMKPLGSNIILGIFEGISRVLTGMPTWIKTNIVDPFINNIKSLFGLDGQESALIAIGKDLISGLKAGVGSIMTNITDWIRTTITDPIVNGVKSLFGLDGRECVLIAVGKDLIGGFKAGVGTIMKTITEWLKTSITDPIVNGIKSLFGLDGQESVLVSVGKNLLEGLKQGLLDAVSGIGEWIDNNVTGPICGFFESLFGISSPSTVFAGYGGYLMEGLENGISDNVDLPKDALDTAKSTMQNTFGALSELLAWAKLGSDIMSLGLKAGIIAMTPSVITIVTTLESDMRNIFTNKNNSWKAAGIGLINYLKQGIVSERDSAINVVGSLADALTTKISEYNSAFQTAGDNLMTSLQLGLNRSSNKPVTTMGTIMSNMYNKADSVGFYMVGDNIATGIYMGLFDNKQWLYTLAWNTAVGMYNKACQALGISSPSKKFAWVGEMITNGLGNGITDNQDVAVDAVADMTDALTDEAQKAKPTIEISTAIEDWISELDNVLTRFSNTVIDKFDSLINTLSQLDIMSASLPAVAQGMVIPSSMQAANSSTDNMSNMMNMLENLVSNQMTAEDLRPLLVEMFTDYMNLGWYIGDEQLARHVNNGNLILGRRYSIIK